MSGWRERGNYEGKMEGNPYLVYIEDEVSTLGSCSMVIDRDVSERDERMLVSPFWISPSNIVTIKVSKKSKMFRVRGGKGNNSLWASLSHWHNRVDSEVTEERKERRRKEHAETSRISRSCEGQDEREGKEDKKRLEKGKRQGKVLDRSRND